MPPLSWVGAVLNRMIVRGFEVISSIWENRVSPKPREGFIPWYHNDNMNIDWWNLIWKDFCFNIVITNIYYFWPCAYITFLGLP